MVTFWQEDKFRCKIDFFSSDQFYYRLACYNQYNFDTTSIASHFKDKIEHVSIKITCITSSYSKKTKSQYFIDIK